ncbi:hypothetical protein [Nocardioides cynanchi]|uniref:hypothetical protein n=1 Tax=Nocardioides cynanchi TaxID=2558918 RepID=UPI001246CACC|nr:hypothetical protein [Nocardioides cynanchi]
MTRHLRRTSAGSRRGLPAGLALAVLAGIVLLGGGAVTGSAAAAAACPPTTVKQDIKAADTVFRGVVTKARRVQGSGKHRTRDYRVAADRIYQGSLVTDKVVVTTRVGTSADRRCLAPLTEGKRYIFFVVEKGARLMATDATARAGRHLTRQVVAQLGDGKQPETQPAPSAEFTTVSDASPPSLSRLLAPGAALVIVSLLGLLVVGRLGRRTT